MNQSTNPFIDTCVEVRSRQEYCIALSAYLLAGAEIWPFHKGYAERDLEECSHHVYGWEPAGFMKFAGILESTSGTYQHAEELLNHVIDYVRERFKTATSQQVRELETTAKLIKLTYHSLAVIPPEQLIAVLLEIGNMSKYSTMSLDAIDEANADRDVKIVLVDLSGRDHFGVSAFQRSAFVCYNRACRAIEYAIDKGWFTRVTGVAPYHNLRISDAGIEVARTLATHPSRVGELVEPISNAYAQRCGCEGYQYAVVVSVEPFALASVWGDKRWQATIEPSFFKVVGQADRDQLERAMRRELA